MLRLASLFVLGVVLSMPSIASANNDCGVDQAAESCDSCCRTRIKLVHECKEVTRCKRVCVTDECGCSSMKRVRCTKTVSRLKFARVAVAPRCDRNNNCGCDSTENNCGCEPAADAGCGCEPADAGCGCDSGHFSRIRRHFARKHQCCDQAADAGCGCEPAATAGCGCDTGCGCN